MAVELIRGSAGPFADRYHYDFDKLPYVKGWAQVDTTQDASYYGTWTNPERREIFNYCEGDTCLTRCDTDAEYVAELRKTAEWNRERGYWLGIDPGLPEQHADLHRRFAALGVEDLYHPPAKE